MILPIGNNCCTATILRDLGYRTCAYPFDWVNVNTSSVLEILSVILIASDNDIKKYCAEIFDQKSGTVGKTWDNKDFFVSNKGIGYPHDKIDELMEKYTRRFIRLRTDFQEAKTVYVFFNDYYGYYDEKLLNIYRLLTTSYHGHHKIKMMCINGFKNPVDIPDIKNINIKHNHIRGEEWVNEHKYFSHEIYKPMISKEYKKFLESFVT